MKSDTLNVLDHGYVKLIRISGCDSDIARSARVSYSKHEIYDELPKVTTERIQAIADAHHDQMLHDAKLIKSLMTREHTSPFEQIQLYFEVKAPIFIFRQWQRHRTWAYNEMSARYTEMTDEFYVPHETVIGNQIVNEKQQRKLEDNSKAYIIKDVINNSCITAYEQYKILIAEGCPRELARCVLPVSIYSSMVASVNLHNWFHFITLRADKHAQWEIQEYARAMWKLVTSKLPIACAAFEACHPQLIYKGTL